MCADEGAEGLVFCGRQEDLGVKVQAALEAKGCAALVRIYQPCLWFSGPF